MCDMYIRPPISWLLQEKFHLICDLQWHRSTSRPLTCRVLAVLCKIGFYQTQFLPCQTLLGSDAWLTLPSPPFQASHLFHPPLSLTQTNLFEYSNIFVTLCCECTSGKGPTNRYIGNSASGLIVARLIDPYMIIYIHNFLCTCQGFSQQQQKLISITLEKW